MGKAVLIDGAITVSIDCEGLSSFFKTIPRFKLRGINPRFFEN